MQNTPEVESPENIYLLHTINKTTHFSIITKIITAGDIVLLK
jgi:hypothetical protein